MSRYAWTNKHRAFIVENSLTKGESVTAAKKFQKPFPNAIRKTINEITQEMTQRVTKNFRKR